jgi:sec-independent protein translocase protein TatA
MFVGEIFGPDLLVVVIVAAILIFGGSAIPKFARNLGQTKSEFEKGVRSVQSINELGNDVSPISDVSGPDATR